MKITLTKFTIFLLLVFSFGISFSTHTEAKKLNTMTVQNKKIKRGPDNVTVSKNNKVYLQDYGFYIMDSKKNKYTIKSSNPKVATVNQYGVVKAKKAGNVTITKYRIRKNGTKYAVRKCNVKVKNNIPIDQKFQYTVNTDVNGQPYIDNIYYVGYDAIVTVPASINGLPIKKISADMFHKYLPSLKENLRDGRPNYAIEQIYIEDGIINIEDHGLSFLKNITKIRLPYTLEAIGSSAFCYCYKLKTINMDAIYRLGFIPDFAFSDCSNLKINLVIPGNVKTIGVAAFAYSGVSSVQFEEGLEVIWHRAFLRTKITKVRIPKSVTGIGNFAFQSNNLEEIVILSNNIGISETAFGNIGLKNPYAP